MVDSDTYRQYLLATNELLLEFAREAKKEADATRRTDAGDFNAGYLTGFYRVISLMQQQAGAYGLEVSDIGLLAVDPNRDLT